MDIKIYVIASSEQENGDSYHKCRIKYLKLLSKAHILKAKLNVLQTLHYAVLI